MTRDYASEMMAYIDSKLSLSDGYAAHSIGIIVAELRTNDPDLLNGWLDLHAAKIIWDLVRDRERRRRSVARRNTARGRFDRASREFEAGDSNALNGWLAAPYVIEDGTHRALGDLNRDDLAFIRSTYAKTAKSAALEQAFIEAIRRRVRSGVVRDHFDDQRLDQLRSSIMTNVPL